MVKCGDCVLVELFVCGGVDIDVRYYNGKMVLFFVCEWGEVVAVRTLFRFGASVEVG